MDSGTITRLRLERLIGRPPAPSRDGRQELLEQLQRALQGERQRGSAGHWSFDAHRCRGLERALQEARNDRDRPAPGK